MNTEKYKKGDEVHILDLFQKSFNKPLSLDFWQWRFGQNPFLTDPMINLMWNGDLLAGHYAVSANEMMIEGKKYLTCLSGTTMTHPDYEGKGIFSSLALSLYDRIATDHDVHAVLGYPNKNSHYGLIKKIAWKDLCVVPTLSISSGRIKHSEYDGLSVITSFTEEHEDFIAQTITDLGFSVYTNRSAIYLNWRYIYNPVNEYFCFEYRSGGVLKGIVISKAFLSFDRPGEWELDLLELFTGADPNVISLLLEGLGSFYESKIPSYVKMNIWISLFDLRYLLLERLGFSPGFPLTYMCSKTFLPGVNAVYDARNWYLAMGDSDVY